MSDLGMHVRLIPLNPFTITIDTRPRHQLTANWVNKIWVLIYVLRFRIYSSDRCAISTHVMHSFFFLFSQSFSTLFSICYSLLLRNWTKKFKKKKKKKKQKQKQKH